MATIECPACGEGEDLVGSRDGDAITVTCGSCGASFPRGSTVRCATCGGTDIAWRAQAMTAFSRGTQLSILGLHQIPMCRVCDAGAYRSSVDAGSALPPDFVPRARRKQD